MESGGNEKVCRAVVFSSAQDICVEGCMSAPLIVIKKTRKYHGMLDELSFRRDVNGFHRIAEIPVGIPFCMKLLGFPNPVYRQ